MNQSCPKCSGPLVAVRDQMLKVDSICPACGVPGEMDVKVSMYRCTKCGHLEASAAEADPLDLAAGKSASASKAWHADLCQELGHTWQWISDTTVQCRRCLKQERWAPTGW